jgi:hypothetical protein
VDWEVLRALHSASVGELAWIDTSGRPDALPVTPLMLDDQPAVAYPYAYAQLARRIALAPAVGLVVSEPRMTGSGWTPVALQGRPHLLEDPSGQLVKDKLIAQELRKYPPSRALADSMLLRKENWWYVPRLIVVLEVLSVHAVAARKEVFEQRVLAVHSDDGLHLDTVQTTEKDKDQLTVASLLDRPVPGGSAVLLGHDFSEPDLEQWTPWTTRGELADRTLTVSEWPERTTLEPVPKLRQRYRRHRELEKGCKAALKSR